MTWDLTRLVGSDGAAGDREGSSVAAYGDTVAVGAYYAAAGAVNWAGAVYVFVRSVSGWSEQQKITAFDAHGDDYFGQRNSVALYGDTLVVGAPGDDDAGSGSGSAYVFIRIAGVWSLQQKITASDAAGGASFGCSVAVEGDTLVVGAYRAKVLGVTKGQAYVFTRSGGVWTERKILDASRVTANQVGYSVAINGTTIAVGAPLTKVGAVVYSAVYVFTGSGAAWVEEQELIPPGAPTNELVGDSVALYGDTLVSGNPNSAAWVGVSQAGTASVWTRSGAVWAWQQALTEPVPELHGWFGYSAALLDETELIIGAPYNLNGDGEAYIFKLSGAWTLDETLTPDPALSNQTFGTGVAYPSADLLAVGARDSSNVTPGGVYVPAIEPPYPVKLPAAGLYIDEIRG